MVKYGFFPQHMDSNWYKIEKDRNFIANPNPVNHMSEENYEGFISYSQEKKSLEIQATTFESSIESTC